ncbi:hypothetical protein ABK040_010932 [Willaertia magna]
MSDNKNGDKNNKKVNQDERKEVQDYLLNLNYMSGYFKNAPIKVSNIEYLPEKPCKDLLTIYTKCEMENQGGKTDILCSDEKEAYLDCRRKFNNLKKELEEEKLVKTKIFYFVGNHPTVESASAPFSHSNMYPTTNSDQLE